MKGKGVRDARVRGDEEGRPRGGTEAGQVDVCRRGRQNQYGCRAVLESAAPSSPACSGRPFPKSALRRPAFVAFILGVLSFRRAAGAPSRPIVLDSGWAIRLCSPPPLKLPGEAKRRRVLCKIALSVSPFLSSSLRAASFRRGARLLQHRHQRFVGRRMSPLCARLCSCSCSAPPAPPPLEAALLNCQVDSVITRVSAERRRRAGLSCQH